MCNSEDQLDDELAQMSLPLLLLNCVSPNAVSCSPSMQQRGLLLKGGDPDVGGHSPAKSKGQHRGGMERERHSLKEAKKKVQTGLKLQGFCVKTQSENVSNSVAGFNQ